MKRTTILAAMVFTGVLFAGCTKDNMDNLNTTAITNGNTPNSLQAIQIPPIISYNLVTEPIIKGQQMQWNSGYMVLGTLIFEGTKVNGNDLSMQKFGTAINTTVKLFEPAMLGSVSAAPTSFNYGMFAIQLAPANSLAPQTTETFFLSGILNVDGFPDYNGNINSVHVPVTVHIPVQVIINGPVLLSSEWLDLDNITLSNFKTYTASLSLNLNKITDNITPEMLANAQKTNGTVLITSSSNQNLYEVIITNLQNNVLQAQFSPLPPVINPNPAPTPVAVTPPAS